MSVQRSSTTEMNVSSGWAPEAVGLRGVGQRKVGIDAHEIDGRILPEDRREVAVAVAAPVGRVAKLADEARVVHRGDQVVPVVVARICTTPPVRSRPLSLDVTVFGNLGHVEQVLLVIAEERGRLLPLKFIVPAPRRSLPARQTG